MTKKANPAAAAEASANDAANQIRAFTEQGVEHSKKTYEAVKANVENAHKAIESTIETAQSAGQEISTTAFAALRQNADANIAHLEALTGARSFGQVIEAQTTFARRQAELLVDQFKEMQAVSQKAANSVAKPMRDAFESSFKSA